MEEAAHIESPVRPKKEQKNSLQALFDFLSSFALASVLLVLLLILTWLGTLEQVDNGLNATVKKYFSSDSFIIFPEFGGKVWPIPLPGAFWVSALLFVNMLCGGIIRARKGWKTVGVLTSHAGILMMLVGGAITHWTAERGNMVLNDGQTSNVAESYDEFVIDIAEIEDGEITKIQTIDPEFVMDLKPETLRRYELSDMPFDLEVMGWQTNAQVQNVNEVAPRKKERVIGDYYLMAMEPDKESPRNMAGGYARLVSKEGEVEKPFILSAATFHPYSFERDGKAYSITARKKFWIMPFDTRLTEFRAEFYPGIARAKSYESDIVRIGEDGIEVPVRIQMNEPMRYEGYTFFQASYGPPDAQPGDKLYTVFEVVQDPADQWPRISLWVVSFGLGIHFSIMLGRYIGRAVTRKKPSHAAA